MVVSKSKFSVLCMINKIICSMSCVPYKVLIDMQCHKVIQSRSDIVDQSDNVLNLFNAEKLSLMVLVTGDTRISFRSIRTSGIILLCGLRSFFIILVKTSCVVNLWLSFSLNFSPIWYSN